MLGRMWVLAGSLVWQPLQGVRSCGYLWEEMMLDLPLEPSVKPVRPPVAAQIASRQQLKLKESEISLLLGRVLVGTQMAEQQLQERGRPDVDGSRGRGTHGGGLGTAEVATRTQSGGNPNGARNASRCLGWRSATAPEHGVPQRSCNGPG